MDIPTKVNSAKIQYIGTTSIPLLWLVFCYEYFNQSRQINYRYILALAPLPFITLILVFTTELHGLIWQNYSIVEAGGFTVLGVTHGVWFWVYWIYAYILLMAGTYFIFRLISTQRGLYRGQINSLVLAIVAPWIGNFLYVTGLGPVPQLDLTPFGFTISVIAIAWGIFQYKLINLLPLARDLIVEEIELGILVINAEGELVDINPAAQTMTGLTPKKAVGKPVAELFNAWPDLTKRYSNVVEIFDELSFGEGGEQQWVEIGLSPLRNKNRDILGRVLTLNDVTNKHRTDEQIKQLSRAVEDSPVSVMITDPDGMIQYVNPKFVQVSGYSLQDVLGNNPRFLSSGLTPRETYTHLWNTIKAGNEWHGELCNRKKNGGLFWESISISSITDGEGTITHFIAVRDDITEKRRIQEQLGRQNEYLSLLHNVALDLLNRKGLDNLLEAIVNRAVNLFDAPYCAIFLKEGEIFKAQAFTKNQQFLADKVLDRSVAKLAWQANDSKSPAILKDYSNWSHRWEIYAHVPLHAVSNFPVIVEGECIAVIMLGRTEPGRIFTDEEIQTSILFSQLVGLALDNVHLYASALNEISERKLAETLLQESEARYRQFVESASDIIYRTDAGGLFTYANPIGLKLMGFQSEDEILGRHYLELVTPEMRSMTKRFYDHQFIVGKENTYFEFVARTQDGAEVWLGQNVQIIRENNQVIGFQAVARDITTIKRAQESLALAMDQALEASRLKGDLLAKVSHELRTPLAGIVGYAELLHDGTFGPLSEDQKNIAAKIVESSDYLTTLINDLLDSAQIEAKKMVLELNNCFPREILRNVVEIMMVLAQKKGLVLKSAVEPNMPETIFSDAQRLQQILINLVGNAIKFTKHGEVGIKLYRSSQADWVIQVSDTGIGIPKPVQTTIFEPFQKVKSTLTEENRGTGLGLSITKQLVELMGGKISVESVAEQGSTFTVVLPIMNNVKG